MARPTNPDLDEPEEGAEQGEGPIGAENADDDTANREGWTGKDGSKSLGHMSEPPAADSSGLATDADDAGRTEQEPGQNTGGSPGPGEPKA